MSVYQLQAKLGNRTSTMKFVEDDDNDAMLSAICKILDRAISDDLWAKGRIRLTNRTTKQLVSEMASK